MDGFLSPPAELARRDSALFDVHIFYCTGGIFGEIAGETLTGRWLRSTGHCACASGVQAVPG